MRSAAREVDWEVLDSTWEVDSVEGRGVYLCVASIVHEVGASQRVPQATDSWRPSVLKQPRIAKCMCPVAKLSIVAGREAPGAMPWQKSERAKPRRGQAR